MTRQRYVAYREVWVVSSESGLKVKVPRIAHAYGDTQEEADKEAERRAAQLIEQDREREQERGP